jgi:shikimate dehydrogenase
MSIYGCIGKKLTHSFSKEIHLRLADYEYKLIELSEDEINGFFEKRDFEAINVTIPYKQTVIPFLDEISDIAKRINAVNTIVNRNGKLYGYNTDYFGMKALIERLGLVFQNKKVLILGTGGTSKTAQVVAYDLGASQILTVSRHKSERYITYDEALKNHADAQIIINTTPVGMYPDCESMPIDISPFKNLEGLIDAVYNPINTNLVLEARERGLKADGGLYMLVAQAAAAVEKFIEKGVEKDTVEAVYKSVFALKENIVLTGMPGSGKTTIGKLINIGDFEFVDTDKEIENRIGCTVKSLIEEKGETYFRDLETQIIRDVSREGGKIIATGGGAILREENVRCLKRNGKLFFIDANFSRLIATDDRPLSNTEEKLKKLYSERIDIYKKTADVTVPDTETPEDAAEYVLAKRMELI